MTANLNCGSTTRGSDAIACPSSEILRQEHPDPRESLAHLALSPINHLLADGSVSMPLTLAVGDWELPAYHWPNLRNLGIGTGWKISMEALTDHLR